MFQTTHKFKVTFFKIFQTYNAEIPKRKNIVICKLLDSLSVKFLEDK